LEELNDDGIYALGLSNTWNIRDGEKTEGVTVGIRSTFYPLTSNATGRIALTGIVHRTFTSTGSNIGEKLVGRNSADTFRSDLDHCLPGDVFRVKLPLDESGIQKYDYYLILTTDPKKDDNGYGLGNVVGKYAKLGTFIDPNTALESNVNSYKRLLNELTVVQLYHFLDPKTSVKDATETINTRISLAPNNSKMVNSELIAIANVKIAYQPDESKPEEYNLTLTEMCTALQEHGLTSDVINSLELDELQSKLDE